MDIIKHIAQELQVVPKQVESAVELLDSGATVPFIARYRKEVTGSLDDTQLRTLSERLVYLRELEERKESILKSIDAQGKLTKELQQAIIDVDNKTTLEDLYLPYKPKRRTKAQIARENGLQPLADLILNHHNVTPEEEAIQFINEQVPDVATALDGAKAILMEQFAEDAQLIGQLRQKLHQVAVLRTKVIAGKESEGEKFSDYFDYEERVNSIPSHRILAILRARNEGIIQASILYEEPDTSHTSIYEEMIAKHFHISDQGKGADMWLQNVVRLAWRAKIFLSLETELFSQLKEQADTDAIHVFASNLKDLLLSSPAGQKVTMGLDPGIRTGVKVAVVDDTGKCLDTATIYPFQPKNDISGSLSTLEKLVIKYDVKLIAIGNGTASRETDKLAGELIKRLAERNIHKVVVSEAGASVYSASKLASIEFPDLDVSLRGAISIARRLQDPLAELVKIDPKSIGVGQYQHDVSQTRLAKSLDAVVEDCVNAVGVDVNTASVALLSRVSGLNQTLAQNIVAYRDENGAFDKRQAFLKVPRFGCKTFEQSAGFLRIRGGSEPLDASAVHPEAYGIVSRMCQDFSGSLKVQNMIGNKEVITKIKPTDYVDERFGLPTIQDILNELEKPGRDPRGEFKTAQFSEGVEEISDLKVGMILEGVVSNVANFGAFVDIGVHQDGLVHISAMSDKYVSDPRQIVKAGDVVKVRVVDVDVTRKRIALSMCLSDKPENSGSYQPKKAMAEKKSKSSLSPMNNAFAEAFAKIKPH